MSKIFEELPSSWEMVRLGDFVDYEKGKKPKHQQDTKDSRYCYPYIDIEAFEENIIKSYADGTNCKMCSEDDFLMVWDGSRSGLVGNGMNGALGSTLVRINFPLILNNYAFYFLFSKYIQINSRAKGSGTPHVDPDLLWNYEFPVAPSNEQNRIVSKIEELFSELDKGIESLKTAREQLKVYRQALLKHAFEGKLTEQWRKDNAAKLETADQLLERIKQEREDRYQQQLDDWKEAVKQWEASGKEGKKPVKPKLISKNDDNYQDISIYSSLPNEWRWVQIIDLLDSKPLNGRSVKDKDGGFRVLRLTSLKSKYIDVNESKEGDWTRDEAKRYLIKRGDFLLSRGNGSIKLVGRGALVKDNYEVAYPDTIVRLSISKGAYLTELFGYFWNSEIFRKQISSSARTTAGIYKINQALISDYYFPLIPLSEQEVLYEILEQHLSLIEVFEKNIIDDIDRSELLRQSILKKAFSGKLVPQDPNDEPASELLKRIAKEKAELEAQEKAAKAAIKKENPPQSPFTPRAPSKKGGG